MKWGQLRWDQMSDKNRPSVNDEVRNVPFLLTSSSCRLVNCPMSFDKRVTSLSLTVNLRRRISRYNPCTYTGFEHEINKIQILVIVHIQYLPSVLWHCWLGIRKNIQSVKNLVIQLIHGGGSDWVSELRNRGGWRRFDETTSWQY